MYWYSCVASRQLLTMNLLYFCTRLFNLVWIGVHVNSKPKFWYWLQIDQFNKKKYVPFGDKLLAMLKTLAFFALGDPVVKHFLFFSLFRSITELLHRKFAMGRRYHHARKSLQYPTTLGRLPSQPNDIYVQVLFHCTTCLLVTHIPRTLLSKGKWSPYCVLCLRFVCF